jgi:kelch-like protein 1/4/5
MPTARDALATSVVGRRLYAVGGYDGISYLNTVEAFNPR